MMSLKRCVASLAFALALVPGCGPARTPADTPSPAVSGPSVDVRHLPLGDAGYSQSAKAGSVLSCQASFSGGGAFANGPWIHSDSTWDSTAKVAVAGQVPWPDHNFSITLDGTVRRIASNGLPSHNTGIFPISSSDPASRYDRNPNSVRAQSLNYTLPANPTIAAQPSCLGMGAIGIMLSGSPLYNAFDAGGRDGVAREIQDGCQGHPDQSGTYHYHNLTTCVDDAGDGHSNLVGYALDGFGIFGPRGPDGHELTDADLDECHGRTDAISWDGANVMMYHYVATREFPYTMSCFKGTPIPGPGAGSGGPRGTAENAGPGVGPPAGGPTLGAPRFLPSPGFGR